MNFIRHILVIKLVMNSTKLNPTWTVASADDAVKNGFFAGSEADGKKVYVGRVTDASGKFLPAKIVPDFKQSFYEGNGVEQSSDKIEFLSNSEGYEWIKSSGGVPVTDAVTIGEFYVGRGVYNGGTVVGRVDLNAKTLVATWGGNALNLPEYDVLVFKPQDNARVQQNVSSSVIVTERKSVNTIVSKFEQNQQDRMVVREPMFNQQRYFEMLNKIQTLELELASYKHDREAYENRIDFEQKRVEDLSNRLQALRLENSNLAKERISWEERITTETTLVSQMESKLQGVLVDNAFLLKKVASLEDALKYERYQITLFNEKYERDIAAGGSLQVKIKNFEETIRQQQQRILELEGALDNINNGSDSLTQQIKAYEISIQNLRAQIDGLVKKLQSANGDNEFLVKKLALLTQSLKTYQSQLEAMSRRLQNSRIVIATANAELGRANGQIAKYQAALSQCYILNGELMTKVSGFSTMSAFQGQFDSRYDILNLSRDFTTGVTTKSITVNTTALLEAAGSDSYVSITKENGVESETSSQAGTPF
ncbi:Peripheral-type benzodiazepine receptor-associated protein 1 [Pseudolycoriella hygida]|uniref:Peripheral-type benzodiazepine receptor-associated protein 1 n=1 Tax=Pseudolycoriella hygida TaxID=35572 RepID=A0A9Q0N5R6_9DIPT|nr:Peripheral-type benzodiazepine receptor-associated protein 1 [Pseudolycoriella hygida]